VRSALAESTSDAVARGSSATGSAQGRRVRPGHKSEHQLGRVGVATPEAAGRGGRPAAGEGPVAGSDARSRCRRWRAGSGVLSSRTPGPDPRPDRLFGLAGSSWRSCMTVVHALCPPVSEEQVLGLLRELKGWAVLAGARGQQPRDVAALAALVSRFSEAVAADAGVVTAVDLNPVMVFTGRGGVRAVDAYVERKGWTLPFSTEDEIALVGRERWVPRSSSIWSRGLPGRGVATWTRTGAARPRRSGPAARPQWTASRRRGGAGHGATDDDVRSSPAQYGKWPGPLGARHPQAPCDRDLPGRRAGPASGPASGSRRGADGGGPRAGTVRSTCSSAERRRTSPTSRPVFARGPATSTTSARWAAGQSARPSQPRALRPDRRAGRGALGSAPSSASPPGP